MPASRSDDSRPGLALPRGSVRIAAIAFVVGVLCFCVVWLMMRNDDIATVAPVATPATTPPPPLPAPLPAGGDGAADLAGAAAADTSVPAAPAEPVSTAQDAAIDPTAPAESAPTETAPSGASQIAAAPAVADRAQPLPIQGQMPAPIYPPAALRRGDGGTVVVRVEVTADGSPDGVALIQRSGSRALDRAAMQAVRRWRFQPALRNGQPVAASLDVPFDFKPGG